MGKSFRVIGYKEGSSDSGITWLLEHRQQTKNLVQFASNEYYALFINSGFIQTFTTETNAMMFLKGFIKGRKYLQEEITNG